MRRTSEWRGLKAVAARLLGTLVLVALLPLSALAVEYTPLAVVKGGKYPVDVAVSSAGNIYVIDGMDRNIAVYGNNYTRYAKFSTVGLPTAIAVFADSIYVGDTFTKSVKILNSSGTEVGDLQKGGATANFRLISNIAVDSNGSVYVVDKFSNTIEVFDAAGNYSYTITGFTMPQDAVVVGDELFVIDFPYESDTLDPTGSAQQASAEVQLSRVQIFDLMTQTFVADETRAFPGNGRDTDLGQYINLKSIAADSQNNIYLVDSYQNTLYKFDINGQFLGIIDELVNIPLGATVSPDGRFVVTSSRDSKVRVIGVDYLAGLPTWLNGAPFAHAGGNQTVDEETVFILDASASEDEDGIGKFIWTQVDGTPVLPSNPYETDSPQLSLTAPGTDPFGTTLVFELIVEDGLGKESNNTSTTTVVVANVISGSVVINDGALYTNDQVVTLTFDVPEAADYRIANDSDPFNGNYSDYTTTTSWTLSDYDPATEANTKIVRVEFRDAGGNTTSASSTILLDMQAPVAPGSIDTSGSPGDLSWAPVADAVSYTLEYAFSPDFSDAVILTDLTTTDLTIALNELAYGTWYWRVAANDVAGNMSDWSAVGTFEHVRPNDPPVADAGANQTVSENTSVVLDASGSTDDRGIAYYTWIQITGTPVLDEDPFITENATVNITSPPVNPSGEILAFELIVTDIFGETDNATTTVTVHNVITGSLVINAGAVLTNSTQVYLTPDAPEAYEMRLANDSDPFGETYVNYSPSISWQLSAYDPATPQNTKTVRVEFRDAGGNTVVASSTIELDMAAPAPPAIDTNNYLGEFNWEAVADAVSYTLQYAYSSDFSNATTLANLSTNEVIVALEEFDDENSYGTWYWRVQATDEAGNTGDWSVVGTFQVDPDCISIVPTVPLLAFPADGATDISRTIRLESAYINYPRECGVHVRTEWQVSRVPDFSTLVFDIETTRYLRTHQVSDLMLDADTTYYWRIKQVANTTMASDWSEVRFFTTAADYDVLGVDGVILDETVQPDRKGNYLVGQPVGDTGLVINSMVPGAGTTPLVIKELDPYAIAETINMPARFPYGLLSFSIAVEPGGTALIDIDFPDQAREDEFGYVYTAEQGWHVNEGLVLLPHKKGATMQITWQDGGIGDADGVVNGIIVNP